MRVVAGERVHASGRRGSGARVLRGARAHDGGEHVEAGHRDDRTALSAAREARRAARTLLPLALQQLNAHSCQSDDLTALLFLK